MLIITRRVGESIIVGDNIEINVLEIKGKQIKIGITAPEDVSIYRKEIYLKIIEENRLAANAVKKGIESLQLLLKEKK
ncbi:MAG: carbon storage regulator [Candidatus Schekmanbacteria bacterium]|nr:MAG: carbon storage regulator [Candidatus Schekmanbacteria bacterium]